MNDRTLVKVHAAENCVDLRTVSWDAKVSRRFYVTRDELARLEQEPYIVTRDVYSFAVLRRDGYRNTLTVEFSWLTGSGGALHGREETIVLPYDELMAFVGASAQEGGPDTWRVLSKDVSKRRPKFEFSSKETLHSVLENAIVRRKLFHFLDKQFKWPDSDRICFYDDFVPYSFFFREERRGEPGICGGLILHGQEDMGRAYYSVHT